jgi:hypothetical protein
MLALLLALTLQSTSLATCRSAGLDPVRTWQFDRPGSTWRVTHWRGPSNVNATRLSLPANALVRLSPDVVSIKARSSNGGIDVALSGTPAEARLDVYVSYELEVNVDASLTPAIDQLNTEGPIGVRCEIFPQP